MRRRLYLLAVSILLPMFVFAQGYNSKGGTHRGYNTPYTQQEQQPSAWSGSGIAIGERYIATNHHVVDGATNLFVCFSGSDVEYRSETVAYDVENDLAIVRIVDEDFPGFGVMKYGFKKEVEDVGMGVFVLGYPLVQTMGTEIKLTTGVVSSRSGYAGNTSQYQISAPVQPGNSGGPLFNDNGELIGIVSAKHLEAENVSYGVKLNLLYELASGVKGINMDGKSKIADMSLSEKCKSVIPFTVMVLANNQRSSSYTAPNTPSYKDDNPSNPESAGDGRSYPIRINNPSIANSNSAATIMYGIELTENYTAIYLALKNEVYEQAYYNINPNTWLVDSMSGVKYKLISTENCAISPEKSILEYNNIAEFVLYFEPLPADTSRVDLIEAGDNAWRFQGIQLN